MAFSPGEGLTRRNLDLLYSVGKILRGLSLPYVLAGDFNVSAACIAESGWVEAVGGTIITPGDAHTCFSSASSSAIDFFVIDARLFGSVIKCFVDIDAHTRPHRPVILKLSRNARSRTINVLWKPRDIPVAPCVGCSPCPPDWTLCPSDDIDAAYGSFMSKAEDELLALHGLSEQGAYRGRGKPFRFITRNIFDVSPCGALATPAAVAWRWISDRLFEVLAYRRSSELSLAASCHLRALLLRLKKFCCVALRDDDLWLLWRNFLACLLGVLRVL